MTIFEVYYKRGKHKSNATIIPDRKRGAIPPPRSILIQPFISYIYRTNTE